MAITKVTSGLISADASSIDLNIDAGTLYLDVSENRVGIGTTSPAYKIDVQSGTANSNIAHFTGSNSTRGMTISTYNADSFDDAGVDLYGLRELRFSTNVAEAMRIDSSGNVGIGTSTITNPYSQTLHTDVNIDGVWGGVISFKLGGVTKGWVGQRSSGNEDMVIGATAGQELLFYENNVEAMRISSGNVGIGTTSPLTKTTIATTAGNTALTFQQTNNSTTNFLIGCQYNVGNAFEITPSTAAGGSTFNSPALVVNSSGNLLVGTTSSPNGTSSYGSGFVSETNGRKVLRCATSSTAQLSVARFYNPNGQVGEIKTDGSSTLYVTSSDYRLKENVVELTGATERLKQLNPSRFNFIADADTTVDGFLAHEVADVVPEAITGTKDAMMDEEYEVTPAVLDEEGNVVTEAVMGTREVPKYQGIDQSKLVPLLTKAIQEQQTIIDNLKTRIETLESA